MRVCKKSLVEPPVRTVFESDCQESFSQILMEVGGIKSEQTMFSTFIVNTAARSCSRKVSGGNHVTPSIFSYFHFHFRPFVSAAAAAAVAVLSLSLWLDSLFKSNAISSRSTPGLFLHPGNTFSPGRDFSRH